MSGERTAQALRQLEALKRDYRERSRAIIDALAVQVRENPEADTLAEAESQLHKLAGSGGSFGFAALSEGARRLELRLRAQRQPGGGPVDGSALATEIAALAEHLQTGSATAAIAQPSPRQGVSEQVYLLEPEQPQAERIASTLLQFGHSVLSCDSLDELRAHCQQRVPRALLIDLDTDPPRDSGRRNLFEAVAELRDSLEMRDCGVFFLTSDDSMDLRLAAARVGARGYFVKPVDPVQVVDRLDMLRQEREAPRYRVLLVDDDRMLARHHATVLDAGGFDVEVVEDPRRALERMEQFRPDLVLLDLYMPGCSGPELARVIRMHDQWVALPIVFLSAETDMELQLTAASEGADDFLTKPIRDAHLIAAVRTRCERAHQMSMLINRDSLTGLLKHSRIKEELLSEVGRAQRQKQPLSVAMLDIDHFKKVNDNYGHPVGDQVIRAVANLLRQRVRSTDRVGRYGGEEFMVVLPNCDCACALRLLDDVCNRFRALSFTAEGEEFKVTLSAGIACTPDFDGAAELAAQADQALYLAKRNGRDRIEIARANPPQQPLAANG